MATETVRIAAKPPGPKGHLLSGHMPYLHPDRNLAFLLRCAREYGDVVRLRFGTKPVFLLNHPKDVDAVLVTRYRQFIKAPALRALSSILGNGLGTSEGEFWSRQRRLIQPAFHHQRIQAYAEVMVQTIHGMLERWQDQQTLDIHQEMTRLTLSVTSKTLFSADATKDADLVADALGEAFEEFSLRLSSFWQMLFPESFPLPRNIRYRKAVRRLDEIIYRIIQDRRERPKDYGDLLSMLLQAQDEDGSRMTDQQLRDEAMTLFLSGYETTTSLLSWTWYLISQHPEVEQKLYAELDTVLGGRPPVAADVPRLRYVDAVLQETLRLYPSVWLLGREPLEDFEAGGYHVPKGSIVLFSPYIMHRDPRYFEDPEEFRPERWEGGLAKSIPRYAFYPFSGGPRGCIGKEFAMMEAILVVASVMQRCRLTLAPGHQVTPHALVTLRPREGIPMVVHMR